MDDQPQIEELENTSFAASHRFLILVAAAIVISLILVIISMEIYNLSGAAQLDLSRPGYVSVRSKAITNDNALQSFPNSGTVTLSTVQQFETIFNQQAQQVTNVDSYGGDPLNPDVLEISAPTSGD